MREATIERKTAETDISLTLNLDGEGRAQIDTGCGFLNHMLTLFTFHSRFDLNVFCRGDVEVDYHHSVEDIGIALGQALDNALGNRAGIARYADIALPMDEALVLVALDISGRAGLYCDLPLPAQKVGDFDTELVHEFLLALVRAARLTLHVRLLAGENTHHIIEAVFKALGRVLKCAVSVDEGLKGQVASSKGVLE